MKGAEPMKDWIHWIGNKYYTIPEFIKEATEMDVSRRIKKDLLKQMEWGDRIFCASKEKGRAHSCIFGYFFVDQIIGIKVTDLPPDVDVKVMNLPFAPFTDQRGCGELEIGACYLTSAKVEDLAECADEPLLAAKGLKILPKPWPVMKTLPAFRGFRRFDGKQFLEDVMALPAGKRHLRNCYYT
jgi:hypothetical protein